MAAPSESHMLLHGGMRASQSILYTSDNSDTQNLIKIGDTIKITGTVSNNGIFTVTDISDGGASLNTDNDVYYVLKGNSIVNEDDTSKEVTIEVIESVLRRNLPLQKSVSQSFDSLMEGQDSELSIDDARNIRIMSVVLACSDS